MKLQVFGRRAALGLGVFTLISCMKKDQIAGDLIDSFKNSCSTWGKWSDGARAQTDSLVATLENLKKSQEAACTSMQATIENIHTLAAKAHGIYGDEAVLRYQQKQEELQELMLTLSVTTDGQITEAVKSALIATQVELAQLRAEANRDKPVKDGQLGIDDRYSQATRELAENFSSLYSQAGDLSGCLNANPASALKLGTALLGVGGNFASPLVGAGVAIVGELMSITVKAVQNYPIDNAIWKLYGTQLPGALTCGLDGMESYYCQAEDAYRLLRHHAGRDPDQQKPEHGFWKGLDVLSKRLPVLNGWMLNIRRGVLPSDPKDAEKVNEVLEKYSMLDTRSNTVIGYLNKGIDLSEGAPPETQTNFLIQYTKTIAELLAGGGLSDGQGGNPFSEFSSDQKSYACWLFLGYVGVTCPSTGEMGETLEEYIRLKLLPGSTTTLQTMRDSTWDEILNQVRKKVNIEFANAIYIDPDGLLTEAQEENTAGDSPLGSLQEIRAFLVGFRERSAKDNPHRFTDIDSTIALIDAAVAIITTRMTPDPADNPLGEIFKMFKLRVGTQFFSKRLSNFVEWDLQDRFKAGELPDDIEEIIRVAGGEIRHRLLAAGQGDYDKMAADLDESRGLSEGQLAIFGDVFGSTLARAVRELDKLHREKEGGLQGADRIHGQRLARLCLTVLASNDRWPDKVSWKICEKQELYSVQHDPKNELRVKLGELERALGQIEDPNQRRVSRRCAFYKFNRASRIKQILQGKEKILGAPGLLTVDFDRLLSDLLKDGRRL